MSTTTRLFVPFLLAGVLGLIMPQVLGSGHELIMDLTSGKLVLGSAVLIFEMTGSVSQMLSLSIVSIAAYITATLLKSRPIYESLLDRLLEGRENEEMQGAGQKTLKEYVVMQDAPIVELSIGAVTWPDNCLLIAIKRGGKEIIPKGKTVIFAGDIIITMTDERDSEKVHDRMEWLCSENYTS